jgi:hypothetical protein
MNSELIEKFDITLAGVTIWLKEIAYQLAVMNEHKELELQRQESLIHRKEALNS